MPKEQCPHERFEYITAIWPDEFTVRDRDKVQAGFDKAPPEASAGNKLVYAALELVEFELHVKEKDAEAIERKIRTNPLDRPLYYAVFYQWLVDRVYIDGFSEALKPPKNS